MKMTTKKALISTTAISALMLLANTVSAHPGHIGEHEVSSMFSHGFTLPLTGIDHLLVMLAVGIWSALTHKTTREPLQSPLYSPPYYSLVRFWALRAFAYPL